MKKILTWTAFSSLLACAVGACSSDQGQTASSAGASNGSAGAAVMAGAGAGSAGAPAGAGASSVAGGSATGGAGSAGANSAAGANSVAGTTSAGGTSGAPAGGAGNMGGSAGAAANGNVISQLLALAKQPCANIVSKHTYALDDGSQVPICATTGAGSNSGAIFWTSDMDIDCDGKMTTECNANTDCCYQNDTAFHNVSDEPLTASVTPYVVIPQDFKYAGLNDGTVIAVIYNNQITYAVWGDTGPTDIIGEASYATAKSLGINPDAKVGGIGGKVVTYIAFLGKQAVPKDLESRTEVEALGAQLAQALVATK